MTDGLISLRYLMTSFCQLIVYHLKNNTITDRVKDISHRILWLNWCSSTFMSEYWTMDLLCIVCKVHQLTTDNNIALLWIFHILSYLSLKCVILNKHNSLGIPLRRIDIILYRDSQRVIASYKFGWPYLWLFTNWDHCFLY